MGLNPIQQNFPNIHIRKLKVESIHFIHVAGEQLSRENRYRFEQALSVTFLVSRGRGAPLGRGIGRAKSLQNFTVYSGVVANF